jgi:hypothetical protein
MRYRRVIAGFLVVSLALSGASFFQRRMDEVRQQQFDDELLYLPNEKLLNHFTAGLSSVVADLLWLKCIHYTSKHFKGDRKFTWLAHMCDTITKLDPHFLEVYRYGGIFLAALKADDDASIKLMKSGIPPNPQRWELPYEIAMVYLLNRGDEPGSPECAAEYLSMAVATGEAPEMVLNVARGLQMKHSLFEIEEAMWNEILETSEDKLMRDMAQRKILELRVREACAMLDEAAGVYAQQFGKPPTNLADLSDAGLMTGTPPSPLGGTYFVDKEGKFQNTTILDGKVEQRLSRLQLATDRFREKEGRWPKALEELVDAELIRAVPNHPYDDGSWQYDAATGEVESVTSDQ